LQLGFYLLIPKPQHSITLLVEISRSQPILALLLRLSMLTAVEFDNQVLPDAAEIGKVGTNPVLPSEFESAAALGSEVRPQLPLLVSRFGTKTPPSIARIFVFGTHKLRASEGTLTKDPLLAPQKKGAFSPYQGKRITAEIVQTPVTGWKPVRRSEKDQLEDGP